MTLTQQLKALWTKDMYTNGMMTDGEGHYCAVGAVDYLVKDEDLKAKLWRLYHRVERMKGDDIIVINDFKGYDAVIAALEEAETHPEF